MIQGLISKQRFLARNSAYRPDRLQIRVSQQLNSMGRELRLAASPCSQNHNLLLESAAHKDNNAAHDSCVSGRGHVRFHVEWI